MRTHYLVIGLAVSIAAHIFLFVPWPGTTSGKRPGVKKPVQVLLPSPEPGRVAEQVPVPAAKTERKSAPKPPSRLREMVRGGGSTEEKPGDTSMARKSPQAPTGTAAGKKAPLPALRLDISQPGKVLTASKSLNVLLVVINGSGQVRARVSFEGQNRPKATPLADTSGYSNRIRLLPRRGYFGEALEALKQRYEDLPYSSRLAFLVPADLDARWMTRQRELLAGVGQDADNYMTVGTYVPGSDGGYRLSIRLARK